MEREPSLRTDMARFTSSGSLNKMGSVLPVGLWDVTKSGLKAYFINTWEIYDRLFSSISSGETFYMAPDPLRNPLIFYWGHTAAFYINKMVMAGLLEKGINLHFEQLFEKGVDPDLPENLETRQVWPALDEVNDYRSRVYQTVLNVIENTPISLPVSKDSPWWALLMSIEHDRIHFETSSVLIRQLPAGLVRRPEGWDYAPSFGHPEENKVIKMHGGRVCLGKPDGDNLYGWENEYGLVEINVKPFEATQNLISNAEFFEFVKNGAYSRREFWSAEGWEWKMRVKAEHPKFWIKKEGEFGYRAMFDELKMPWDWPVEVNAHEARAYCNWKGNHWRLLSETEFTCIANGDRSKYPQPFLSKSTNCNLIYGSPTPVGFMPNGDSTSGFNDIYGNVWDWLNDDFYPLPGFKAHPLYEDFSQPYFDEEHSMLLGGSWASTGTSASHFYRLWFRRHFFQHAGFRMARDL